MGDRPIALKCPHCHRGEHLRDRPERGVVQSGRTRQQRTWNTRRLGATFNTMHESRCLDCGHAWWSTLAWVVDAGKFANYREAGR